MKKQFLLFLLITFSTFAFVQTAHSQIDGQEKTISINDIRKLGIIHYDTSTAGHHLDEVIIDRVFSLKSEYMDGAKDTLSMYKIQFFKMFENKLKNYHLGLGAKEDFDKASYKWLNDTIVSVTLFNSITKENKNLKLVQTFSKGSSAGILKVSDELDMEK